MIFWSARSSFCRLDISQTRLNCLRWIKKLHLNRQSCDELTSHSGTLWLQREMRWYVCSVFSQLHLIENGWPMTIIFFSQEIINFELRFTCHEKCAMHFVELVLLEFAIVSPNSAAYTASCIVIRTEHQIIIHTHIQSETKAFYINRTADERIFSSFFSIFSTIFVVIFTWYGTKYTNISRWNIHGEQNRRRQSGRKKIFTSKKNTILGEVLCLVSYMRCLEHFRNLFLVGYW